MIVRLYQTQRMSINTADVRNVIITAALAVVVSVLLIKIILKKF